jgi:hypothetical protein
MNYVNPSDREMQEGVQARKKQAKLQREASGKFRQKVWNGLFAVLAVGLVTLCGFWGWAHSDPDPKTFGRGFVERHYLELSVVEEACVAMVKGKYGNRVKQLVVDNRSSREDLREGLMKVFLKAELYPYLGFRKTTDFYEIYCFSNIKKLELERFRMLKASSM